MRDQIVAALGITSTDPGVLTLHKSVFTLRREYFWTPKKTIEEFFAPSIDKLKQAGYNPVVLEYGNHYTSFKGGQGVKKNSHYWMKFKLQD